MMGRRWTIVAAMLVLVAAGGLGPGVLGAAEGEAGVQPAQQEEFVPISELPPEDQLPAAPLLVAAYAVAWLAVFGYLWTIWRRLGRVEREIAELAKRTTAR